VADPRGEGYSDRWLSHHGGPPVRRAYLCLRYGYARAEGKSRSDRMRQSHNLSASQPDMRGITPRQEKTQTTASAVATTEETAA
jgi:hypothetical protein